MALELHLDASKIEGLEDGNAVSPWADESGNERDVTQAEEAKQPTYKTGVLNSKPVVRFDGEDWLQGTGWELAQPNTIFIVARVTTAGGNRYFHSGGEEGKRHALLRVSGKSGLSAGGLVEGSAMDEDWHLFTELFDGASSALRVDGVIDLEGNVGAEALGGFTVGATDSGGAALVGDVAEVRVYGTALSTEERETIEGELNSAWGLTNETVVTSPVAAATASVPIPVVPVLPIVAPPATATASALAADVALGNMPSPTEQGRHGLPLPHPSILANPDRLGPPRFTSVERRRLGI